MKHFFSALKLTLAASVLYASAGCVSSRDVRNGVFDENQYLRKSMLVNPATDATDPPWILQGTVEQVSSPNPLSGLNFFVGTTASTTFKWRVTSDKLQMVSQRSLNQLPDSTRTDAVLNAWPVTNVDLKLRVNLDGETTNFYEENQEQPWARRQFVKLTLAKNDVSDVAVLDADTGFGAGSGLGYITDSISKCIDAGNTTATLVPDSFKVDEASNYITWKIQVTMPFVSTDPVCSALLTVENLVSRTTITSTIMYSMQRMKPIDGTESYKPLEVPEKDPIRRKYGIVDFTSAAYAPHELQPDPATGEDPNLIGNSGLLSARQLAQRFDLTKDVVYYLDPQMPERYIPVFNGPGGIAEQTNAIFTKAGVKGRLFFKAANDGLPDGQSREFGDVRYSFVRYVTDPGVAEGLLGIAGVITDPRTGETLKGMFTVYNQGYLNEVAYQYDALLKTIGASEGLTSQDDNGNAIDNPWKALPEPCKNGDHLTQDDPRIVTPNFTKTHHNQSTLFNKIQQYLNKPATTYGNLAPSDFAGAPDPKYRDIYFDLLPFFVYREPAANPFVTPEGGQGVFGPSTAELWSMRTKEAEFQKILGDIDKGLNPYDATDGAIGIQNAVSFVNHFRDLTLNHRALRVTLQNLFGRGRDLATPYPLMQAYAQGSRRCVDHKWETRTQFVQRFIDAQMAKTMWHEFGHSLGLLHNFMGSVDERNWPRYTDEAGDHYMTNSSSVMDYTTYYAESTFGNGVGGWGPYDQGALAWAYGNDAKHGDSSFALGTLSVSGQVNATTPWNDPLGFDATGKEITFLRCDDLDISRTPLCQQFDWGATPSQITAAQIDDYDWQYQFRNQRGFFKFKSFENYGTRIANLIVDSRRFIPFAADVQGIGDIIRKLKIPAPQGIPQATFIDSVGTQLIDSVTAGSTQAAALHKAIIEQASAERPFSTSVDQRYGDVNVQGIIIDKVFAAQGWLGLAPVLNQDPNVTGRYSAPYTEFVSPFYITVAADTLDTVLGGGYDTYPWLIQSNIALFAEDSHSQNFNIGFAQYREWIGMQTFTRETDFLAYFQAKAEAANFNAVDPTTGVTIDCRDAALDCKFDIRNFSDRLQTITLPDGHNWTWMYIKDRNAWMAAERDRNPVTYRRIRDYTSLLATGADDDNLYDLERPLKFYYDAFTQFR